MLSSMILSPLLGALLITTIQEPSKIKRTRLYSSIFTFALSMYM